MTVTRITVTPRGPSGHLRFVVTVAGADAALAVRTGASRRERLMADAPDQEKQALKYFLDYQRASVLAITEGLDEAAWHRSVVPSGWTPAGLVEHLGDAERHWFQDVVTGSGTELAWVVGRPAYDPNAALRCARPAAEVVAYYREQIAASDAVLEVTPLSA